MFAMKKIKITKAELEMVQEAADRLARRTGERVVLNRDRLEVVPDITYGQSAD
jgi:RNA-binding protein YhbY